MNRSWPVPAYLFINLASLVFTTPALASTSTKQIDVKASAIMDIERVVTVAETKGSEGVGCAVFSKISIRLANEKKPLTYSRKETLSDRGDGCTLSQDEKDNIEKHKPAEYERNLLQALIDIKEKHINQEHVVEGDYFRVICSRPSLRLELSMDTLEIVDWQIGRTAIRCP